MPPKPMPNLSKTEPTPDRPDEALLRLVVLVLFAASGCAALIYQIVWFERLSLAIGSSALSLGVLLATFLGGMGLGAALFGRLALPGPPLRLYAAIELLIGLFGLATLALIPALGGLYTAWAGSDAASLALRLVVAAVTLLPGTVLLGATLPVIAAWLRTTERDVAWLGYCYAANTAGAVCGSLLAAFYLLRVYDVTVATLAAVALNVAVAAAAVSVAAIIPRPAAARAALPRPQSRVTTIHWVTALSGMTALGAEVLWTRHLSLLLGGTVYTFALILAVLLAGLALGSGIGAALGRRWDAWRTLAACQWLLCAAMAYAALMLARSLPFWPIDVALPTTAGVALSLDLVRVTCVVLPAALLWGASFPLALAAAAGAGDTPPRLVGGLYAANTLGAIVGALAMTFVLIVTVGSQRAQQVLIAVSACAGLLLWLRSPLTTPRLAAAVALTAVALALAATVASLPPNLIAYGRFLMTRGADANVIYVGEGLTASIAVSREPSGILTYHNAGKTQASTYPQDLRLQRMLGHLTTLLAERPSTVLVIGLGAGVTAGAVSIDPAVERVIVAELEPLVPDAANEYFATANFGVVDNAKVEIRIDDGRHFLATTAERFDAITSDPLDPWVKGAAALYTREFWQLAKARLNDGGVVTVFVQLYESTEDAVRSEIATFFEVFPDGAVFANTVEGMGYDLVLVGRASAAPIDLSTLGYRLAGSDYATVARSLREVGFVSALDLASTYSGGASDLASWLANAPINTDANLRLQYLAGQGLNVYQAAAIFGRLVGNGAAFPAGLFTGTTAELEELRQRLAARQRGY